MASPFPIRDTTARLESRYRSADTYHLVVQAGVKDALEPATPAKLEADGVAPSSTMVPPPFQCKPPQQFPNEVPLPPRENFTRRRIAAMREARKPREPLPKERLAGERPDEKLLGTAS